MASALEFPYQFNPQYRNWFPVIPLKIHGIGGRIVETSAYLDSGAAFNVFRTSEAIALGFDLSSGRQRSVTAGDGKILNCRVFTLKMELGPYRFNGEIGFSRELRVGFNLLGLNGFFDNFHEVSFRHSDRRVVIRR